MPTSNGNLHWPADTGLLLVGHGSRERVGQDEFLATAALVATLAGEAAVEPCFLEFARPTIAEGFRTLVRRGARRIVVVPVLLFAAGHAKRDIPAAVAAVAADVPDAAVGQSEHLGCHEAILELSRLRYDEAIGEPGTAGDDSMLVMVGRGSHNTDASAEMRQFVERRGQTTPIGRARACFLAMAEPRLTGALDEAVAHGARRIVVQPHLLFGGVLVERIGQTVADYAVRYPHMQWVTTGYLGPSPLLARAVLGRAAQQLSGMANRYSR